MQNACRKSRIDAKFDLPETVTHSKVVVIDDKQLVIGSHNWTRNSLARTEELSVLVDSPDRGKRIQSQLR